MAQLGGQLQAEGKQMEVGSKFGVARNNIVGKITQAEIERRKNEAIQAQAIKTPMIGANTGTPQWVIDAENQKKTAQPPTSKPGFFPARDVRGQQPPVRFDERQPKQDIQIGAENNLPPSEPAKKSKTWIWVTVGVVVGIIIVIVIIKNKK